ncbi:MAG TPA: hypothetical protein VL860_09615 [Planctomycetota bacterium]|nr:hypothetical protein [Planctomycetota bacterium]
MTATPPTPHSPTRSKLITWTVALFGLLQGLAILSGGVSLVMAILHEDSLMLFFANNCLDHLALIPLLLAIFTLMLARTHRYQPAAKRLSWIVIVHYLVKLVFVLVTAVALMVCFVAIGFKIQNTTDPVQEFAKAQAKATAAHPGLFLSLAGATLAMELFFTLLWVGAVRRLRPAHFLPPEPPAPAAPASPQPPAPASPTTPGV